MSIDHGAPPRRPQFRTIVLVLLGLAILGGGVAFLMLRDRFEPRAPTEQEPFVVRRLKFLDTPGGGLEAEVLVHDSLLRPMTDHFGDPGLPHKTIADPESFVKRMWRMQLEVRGRVLWPCIGVRVETVKGGATTHHLKFAPSGPRFEIDNSVLREARINFKPKE